MGFRGGMGVEGSFIRSQAYGLILVFGVFYMGVYVEESREDKGGLLNAPYGRLFGIAGKL